MIAHINTPERVKRDIDLVEQSMDLHRVRRFFHQRYFETETADAEYASRIETGLRLESVSEHSWHVADVVLLLGHQFRDIRIDRATQLAVIHDKMELFIGDIDPIGRDGTGKRAHAFNQGAKDRKAQQERKAIDTYVDALPDYAKPVQSALLEEALQCSTPEAQFVKSVDKLVALVYVLKKKLGRYEDKHLRLLLRLTERNAKIFNDLDEHHWEVFDRILTSAAKRRRMPTMDVVEAIQGDQLNLF